MSTSKAKIRTGLKNVLGTDINPATEEKQDAIVTALGNVKIDTGDIDLNTDGLETIGTATNTALNKLIGFEIPPHDTQAIDESLAPATTTITYKKSGATVAVKTITVSGTTTTISVVIS
jgi:hypothetical protein